MQVVPLPSRFVSLNKLGQAGRRIVLAGGIAAAMIGSIGLLNRFGESFAFAHGVIYASLVAALLALAFRCMRLTARVAESEGLFCQATESLDGCAIFTLNDHGLVSSWNHPAGDLVARNTNEAIGRPIKTLFPSYEGTNLLTHALAEAGANGWSTVDLHPAHCPTDTMRITLTTLQNAGSVTGFLVTLRDMPQPATVTPVATEVAPIATVSGSRGIPFQPAAASNCWAPTRAASWANDPDTLIRRPQEQRRESGSRTEDAFSFSRKTLPGTDATESARRPFDFQHSQARALFKALAESGTSC